MKILLTGATGFIGRRVTKALATEGHELGLLVRPESLTKAQALFSHLAGIQFIEADISRNDVVTNIKGATEKFLLEAESVVHLAGQYDLSLSLQEAYAHNVIGTQNMVWFARHLTQLKIFHHISSYAVNAHCDGFVSEDHLDTAAKLPDHYAQTKLQSESIVRQADWKKSRLRIYRPGVVIGDSRTGEMDKIDGPYFFFKLFSQLQKHKAYTRHIPFFPVVGSPGAHVPMIPVDIITQWLAHMVTHPTAHERRAYHLVSQEKIFVENFLRLSLAAFEVPIKVKRLPETRMLDPILPMLGLPAEISPYLYSIANFSRETIESDYPELQAPLLENFLPNLVNGCKELFR
jgi:nucleoside-diphosphate-sugar epimerase